MQQTNDSRFSWRGSVGLVLAVGIGAAGVSGDDIRWIEAAGGDFDDVANWEGGVVPGATDVSIFDLSSVYNITLNQDQVVRNSFFRAGTVTMDLGGFDFTNANGPEGLDIVIGQHAGEEAALEITNGSLLYRIEMYLGQEAGAIGHLTLRGANTVLGPSETSSNGLTLGRYGTGYLEILEGAIANVWDVAAGPSDGTAGYVLVDGAGSELNVDDNVWVGMNGGVGSLTVQNGAVLEIEWDSHLWIGGGGEGLVTGTDSRITMLDFFLDGIAGGAKFTLADGASMELFGETLVGEYGGHGELIYTGTGTAMIGGRLQLGNGNTGGTGRLEISDGAFYDCGFSSIVSYGVGTSIEIAGADTVLNGNSLYTGVGATTEVTDGAVAIVGDIKFRDGFGFFSDPGTYVEGAMFSVGAGEGAASALIQNGAIVKTRTNDEFTVGHGHVVGFEAYVAELTVDGTDTVLDIGGTMNVGKTADQPGVLNITNGGTVLAHNAVIGAGGILNGEITIKENGNGPQFPTTGLVSVNFQAEEGALLSDDTIDILAGGTLTGDDVLTANVQNQGGRIAPGAANHQLTINGLYQQYESASMRIRMVGWYDWDQLHVLEDVAIAGGLTIEVPKPGDWTPPFGRTYRFLTAPTIVGEFDYVTSNSYEIDFELTYGVDFVEYTVVQPLQLEVANLVGGQTANFTVRQGTPGGVTSVLYGFRSGVGEFKSGDWCVLFGFDVPAKKAMNRVVVSGRFNKDGIFEATKKIPGSASGMDLYLQAAQMGSCPGVLMSNVVQEVVG